MTVVAAPRAGPPRMGLVVSADPPPAGEGEDWTRGLEYEPETCGGYRTVGVCSTPTGGAEAPTPGGLVRYTPWAVEVWDACTTLGGDRDADDSRLLRRLEQRVDYAVARELWTGDQAAADASANLSLASPASADAPITVLGGGAVSASAALGLLVGGLGDCGHGQRGMVHAPRRAGVAMTATQRVARVGNLLVVTATDDLLVVDAGYPGTAPAGQAAPGANQQWVFASLPVTVRLSRPQTEDGLDVVVATNRRVRYATRLAAATFDPCCRFAALVDLTL